MAASAIPEQLGRIGSVEFRGMSQTEKALELAANMRLVFLSAIVEFRDPRQKALRYTPFRELVDFLAAESVTGAKLTKDDLPDHLHRFFGGQIQIHKHIFGSRPLVMHSIRTRHLSGDNPRVNFLKVDSSLIAEAWHPTNDMFMSDIFPGIYPAYEEQGPDCPSSKTSTTSSSLEGAYKWSLQVRGFHRPQVQGAKHVMALRMVTGEHYVYEMSPEQRSKRARRAFVYYSTPRSEIYAPKNRFRMPSKLREYKDFPHAALKATIDEAND
jgi:hypothetical protein